MARTCTMLPLSFCLNRFPLRIWVRPSQRIDSKAISAAAVVKSSGDREKQAAVLGRRIMVVVDSSREAKAAVLQWALSHTVQSQDTIVLVDVIKSSSFKSGDRSAKEKDPKSYARLYAMKKFCQTRRPEVEVEVSLVDGIDQRGPAIVAEAKRQGVSLLVLGRRKRPMTWRLLMMWAGRRSSRGGGGGGGGVVDYCIQNASCMTLAVGRKSRRGGGGYLITSRRHKNFWLLA